VDLSAVASLQAATVPVTFAIDFTGNPTGQSSYEIGALRLTGDQCTPAITGVTPGSLPQLTDDCFVVDGECLDHLVGVTWDGQTIPGGPGPFPGHYGEAFYTPVGANQIRVCPPFCEPIGDHEIRLFFANDSLATIVAITTPAAPTLLCEHAPKIDFEQCVYISSGPLPGPNALFVGLSLSNSPTVVPGILNFDIGAQFSSLVCLNAPPGECTKVRIGMIPPAFLGLTQFFQGIVWNFGSTVLPLPTTNVCASTYVN
ncbi:MAG: hypothetical protein KDE27_21125, partial [Planctomycetes bacterium]|nr:hypothetical protein [Planctomycetota bacterium]